MKKSAFKMKYTKGGFPFKVDLTKKTGLGPRTDKAMGKQFAQGDDKFKEEQEDRKNFPVKEQDPKYFDLEKYDDDRG